MRRSAASARGGFRRSSQTALASVCEVMVIAALLVGCGGVGVTQGQSIPFTDHGSTQQSAHDGAPRIAAASDPATLGLGELATRADGRLYIAVFAGSQRTGGLSRPLRRVDHARRPLDHPAMVSSPPAPVLISLELTIP